jgi:hypothetical protein
MKRSRGRNRRNGGSNQNNAFTNPNRHFESVGPDVKIRGSAQQVLDKYLQYARDAQTSGDRILSEAYFQFAEHYQRIVAKQAEARLQQSQQHQSNQNQPRMPRDEQGGHRPPRSDEMREDSEAVVESRSPQRDDADDETGDTRADSLRIIDGDVDQASGQDVREPRRDRGERSERGDRNERERGDRDRERGDRDRRDRRPPYQPREDRGERSERSDRGERAERSERGERGDRAERPERVDRAPREERQPRTDVAAASEGIMKTLARGRRRPVEEESDGAEES